MRTKISRILILLMSVTVLLACSDTERIANCFRQSEVRFNSLIKAYPTRTANGGDEWKDSDEIGIYMKLSTDDVFGAGYKNYRYTVSPDPSVSLEKWLIAGNGEDSTIYFPQSMEAIDFIAYYPYSPKVMWTDNILHLDINNQSNQEELDVLYAFETLSSYTEYSAVRLNFAHKTAKLRIHVNVNRGTKADLSDIEMMICDIPDTASLHLANGEITATGMPKNIAPKNMGVPSEMEKDTASFQCIVIPHSGSDYDNRKLLVTADGKRYVWNIPDAAEFESGKVYTYNLALSGQKIVEISGLIEPWDDNGPDSPVEASEITAPQSGTPMLVELANKTVMQTVYIRKGTFMMGSPADELQRTDSSETRRRVKIEKDFMMGQYEVTNDQFADFLNAKKILSDGKSGGLDWVKGAGQSDMNGLVFSAGKWSPLTGKGNYPVSNISWHGARAYAEWAGNGCRLPSEEEWEYACRAGTGTAYFFGEDTTLIADYVRYRQTSRNVIAATGSLKPNNWGLYDVCGNVFEWCADNYSKDFSEKNKIANRSLRGGAYSSTSRTIRSSYRLNADPKDCYIEVGFRVVFDVPKVL